MQRRWIGGLLAGGTVAVLAACSSSGSALNPANGPKTISVVASTNVYGDIAHELAGDQVKVTSIISDPAQDPHSYEANAQTQLELSKANVVVENGGGYDDFVDTMLKSANNKHAAVLNVVDISGKQAQAGADLNEHVWYDFPTVAALSDRLVAALSAADPTAASTFAANGSTFRKKLADLEATEASIKSEHGGEGVAITEPVPLYLLTACGLQNKTPVQFSEAVEEGTDVAAGVLQQTLTVFRDHQVKLLVYNAQTSGPETDKVVATAKSSGVAVVPVTETLPTGQDYLSWMSANLAAVKAALS